MRPFIIIGRLVFALVLVLNIFAATPAIQSMHTLPQLRLIENIVQTLNVHQGHILFLMPASAYAPTVHLSLLIVKKVARFAYLKQYDNGTSLYKERRER